MKKIWNKWWLARLEFILAAIEFGTERWLYLSPRQEKKQEYVEARAKVRALKKTDNTQPLKRKGKRGK